jgi:hypothetical protein
MSVGCAVMHGQQNIKLEWVIDASSYSFEIPLFCRLQLDAFEQHFIYEVP